MKHTPTKDHDYYIRCAWRMEIEGGSFAHHIARAYYSADKDNKDRLVQAFAHLFDRYAPRVEEAKQ